ncbi:TIGR04086 family membrane protein [Microbacterium album]|uniref:Uncharacterized protein n=1 Tax=Microbacterium album TaxID=2053191 RepID=A0A917IGW0_9MICO|nr:TIGR04086 family membrane protein [Microbacterium album]GGH45656.1 hypothetical protein GCM10010921_21210 [Microbacterium album]
MSTPTNSPEPRREGGEPNPPAPDYIRDESGNTYVRADRAGDGVRDGGDSRAAEHGTYVGGDGDAGYRSDEPTRAYATDADRDRDGRDDGRERRDDVRDRDRDADRTRDAERRHDDDRPRDRDGDGDRDGAATAGAAGAAGAGITPGAGRTVREEVVAREKDEFGGMKFGSAFFGWLCAMGMTVLLTALVAGAGAALGLGANVDPGQAADDAMQNADTIGIVGAIAVLVILFISYYAGGYVAGRMARFSGALQGVAVWLWALIIAVVVAIITAIAGAQWNILANVNTFPRLPFNEGELTTAGIITAIGALLVSLGGAVLGGIGGMRYHRRVDRAGLGR